MIRVLLVDDQHLVRTGLRMLCESAPDIAVVGEAADGHAAVRLADQVRPDVVVMDLRMPILDGTTATERITAARPGTRVIALTTFGDDDHLYPALAAGACGFLVKNAPPAELLDAIRRAHAGDTPFSQAVLGRLVDQAIRARGRPDQPLGAPLGSGLSPREREILVLIANGLSNQEIADRLHIGITTVKTHITGLITKTGSRNRIRLAVLAAQSGLTEN